MLLALRLVAAAAETVLATAPPGPDGTLLSDDVRAALEVQGGLVPPDLPVPSRDVPRAADARLEEMVHLYHDTPERHRTNVLSVLRALVSGLRNGGG